MESLSVQLIRVSDSRISHNVRVTATVADFDSAREPNKLVVPLQNVNPLEADIDWYSTYLLYDTMIFRFNGVVDGCLEYS